MLKVAHFLLKQLKFPLDESYFYTVFISFVQGDLEADPLTLFESGDTITDATDILHPHYFPEPPVVQNPLEGSAQREMLSPSQTTAPPPVC